MGWLGNILILTGAWNIGRKRRWGFLLAICGSACWITQGLMTGQADLAFIETAMSAVAIRNFILWGKHA